MSSPASSPRFCLPFLAAALLALAACRREPPPPPPQAPVVKAEAEVPENGAISMAPMKPEPARADDHGKKNKRNASIDWSPVELQSGRAWFSCELDYARQGDGAPILALDRQSLIAALRGCADRGLLRLRYQGRVAADFAALVERITRVADDLKIGKRILDLDSAGGQVEDAIRAGDFIAESRWTIWIREGSLCHSACVFVLSAGDVRRIAGKVGIHRIIRMSSTATTRAELNAELRLVYEKVRSYLERNGTNVAVADLMLAVPNRSLRLLTDDELLLYGLYGVNPAQDDLDRLRLLRECGDDFVARRDAFAAAFDRRCRDAVSELGELNACGLALRKNFGFPDNACPAESPLSEFDLAQLEPAPDASASAVGKSAATGAAAGAEGQTAPQAASPTPQSK